MSQESSPLQVVRTLELAAASGLVRLDGRFFVVADDELELHAYAETGPPTRFRLRAGELPREPKARKRAKPDYEALCPWAGRALLAFGSGSTLSRRTGALIQLTEDMSAAISHEFSLAPLYEALAAQVPELNVEGAAPWGDDLVLLQRGNGRGNRSALVRLDRAAAADALLNLSPWTAALIRELAFLDLGELGGVPLGVTDAAALPDGGLLLTAAAEDSSDTYLDGACLGSALLRIDRPHAITWCTPLPGRAKFEGVWADPAGERVRVHLVADADDPTVRSPLLTALVDPRTGALSQ